MPGAHHGSTYACRTADCRCVRYTPDFKRAVAEREDTLSTSARLALTEQRLAETERERDGLSALVDRLAVRNGELIEDEKRLIAERDEARDEVRVLKHSDALTVVVAESELVSARQEIEQLRAMANLGREARQLLATAPPAVDVISAQVRYLCETCGARYGYSFGHEHGPLTPVVVTIARQGAPTE
jgi:hypothetical protein